MGSLLPRLLVLTGALILAAPAAALGGYRDEVLADGPLHYWRLGDAGPTAADLGSPTPSTGTYQGDSAAGATGALYGDTDTAVALDGLDDRITLGTITTPATITVEAWLRTTASADGPGAFTNRTNHKGVYLGVRHGVARLYDGGSTPYDLYGTKYVNDGEWHHVAFTHDGTTARLYVDGQLDVFVDQTRQAHTAEGFVGYDESNKHYWNGGVDEVAVYGTALSAERIAAHYAAGMPPPPTCTGSYANAVRGDQPVHYWRLGDAGSVAADAGRTPLAGEYRGGVVKGVPGALTGDPDTAAEFDGVDGLVAFDDVATEQIMSIEAWVKTPDAGDQRAVFSNRIANDNGVYFGTWHYGQLRLYDGLSSPSVDVIGPTVVDDNVWHHLVFTHDGTTSRLYVDGKLDHRQTQTRQAYLSPGHIAYDVRNGHFLPGTVDEVAIYDHELSADAIAVHHLCAKSPDPDPDPDPDPPPPGTPDSAPVNEVPPTVAGTPRVGETLTCEPGTWTDSPTGYTYRWRRDGVAIAGATAGTYTTINQDRGSLITCEAVASNSFGSSQPAASSNGALLPNGGGSGVVITGPFGNANESPQAQAAIARVLRCRGLNGPALAACLARP